MRSSSLATAVLSFALMLQSAFVAADCVVACKGDCLEKPNKVYMYRIMPTQYSSGGQWSQNDNDNGYMAQVLLTNNILTLDQVRIPGTNPIVPATYLYQLIHDNGATPQFWYLNAGDHCTADLSKGISEVHLWVGLP